jgi:hypothetical protein
MAKQRTVGLVTTGGSNTVRNQPLFGASWPPAGSRVNGLIDVAAGNVAISPATSTFDFGAPAGEALNEIRGQRAVGGPSSYVRSSTYAGTTLKALVYPASASDPIQGEKVAYIIVNVQQNNYIGKKFVPFTIEIKGGDVAAASPAAVVTLNEFRFQPYGQDVPESIWYRIPFLQGTTGPKTRLAKQEIKYDDTAANIRGISITLDGLPNGTDYTVSAFLPSQRALMWDSYERMIATQALSSGQ